MIPRFQIPNDLRQIWTSHFNMIKEIGDIRFKRAVVPSDAKNLEIDTIDMVDASTKFNWHAQQYISGLHEKMASISCELIFARSKIIPNDLTISRAELFAAHLNATTGHIVKAVLKQWVHNRINEIN